MIETTKTEVTITIGVQHWVRRETHTRRERERERRERGERVFFIKMYWKEELERSATHLGGNKVLVT